MFEIFSKPWFSQVVKLKLWPATVPGLGNTAKTYSHQLPFWQFWDTRHATSTMQCLYALGITLCHQLMNTALLNLSVPVRGEETSKKPLTKHGSFNATWLCHPDSEMHCFVLFLEPRFEAQVRQCCGQGLWGHSHDVFRVRSFSPSVVSRCWWCYNNLFAPHLGFESL